MKVAELGFLWKHVGKGPVRGFSVFALLRNRGGVRKGLEDLVFLWV